MDRSLRNVLVVSLGFLLLFTAYGGLQSLQSSLYSEDGLGVTVLSTLYGGVLLSSMFLPPLLIRTLGCKWTIVLSMSCYVTFSLGNFYASWYTLVPTSILLGLGAAPLWSAHCTYLTIMGNTHAEKAGKVGKDVVNHYFGIFFLIFQSAGVWGNLISSLVFGQTPTQGAIPEGQLLSCGASDCLMATAPTNSTQRPSQELIYTLLGIYTGTSVLSGSGQSPTGSKTSSFLCWIRPSPQNISDLHTVLSTGSHSEIFTRSRSRLTVLTHSFLWTRTPPSSYTTCALGIQFVGYVMICFAATNALCSELYGKLAQYTGRVALYALGRWSLSQMPARTATLPPREWLRRAREGPAFRPVTVELPRPGASVLSRPPEQSSLHGLARSGVGGLLEALGDSQLCICPSADREHSSKKIFTTLQKSAAPRINGPHGAEVLYGVLFEKNKEAAFANYRLWEALGFIIAFGYSTFLCVHVKLYILLGVLCLTMVAYGIVEYLESKNLTTPLAVGLTKAAEEAETQTKM
ncbi:PREDICTED: protein unc-93 homolog A [Hipposideros armiger]|uniref:Protein unc-93 homolog A n=1 Tax=Hipposideros armiger TaxID=186990 RepID=A0A8B7SQK8_HIPAR|nr:PREDICTED: protein unc-93 homolog A [Hipposideros armiger]